MSSGPVPNLPDGDQKRAGIEKAMREAELSEFISAEAMNAWIDSWGSDSELPPPEVDIF